MKKTNVIIILVGLLMGSFLSAAAQESTFEDNDLFALKDAAKKMLENRILRITSTEERFIRGEEVRTMFEKSVNEIVPPNRSHFVVEYETPQGMKRTEYIDIGTQRYIKENGGEWKIFQGSGIGAGNGSGNGGEEPRIETVVAKKLKKGEIVNNQTTDLYETVVTQKRIYSTKTYTSVSTTAFWFDSEGRYVKTFEEYREDALNTVARTTQEYEYDLKNLKIEAPIIKGRTKVRRKS